MKFVKLTGVFSKPVYVNPDSVALVENVTELSNDGVRIIFTGSKTQVIVKGTVEEVIAEFNKADAMSYISVSDCIAEDRGYVNERPNSCCSNH